MEDSKRKVGDKTAFFQNHTERGRINTKHEMLHYCDKRMAIILCLDGYWTNQ